MRVGDFGVEVVPVQGGQLRELDSGHVLARPGVVYAIRLRNYGPLRCVAEVRIDGKAVSGAGLVLDPWSVAELQRPLDADEHGRFTVVAEGDEHVFGPDGGRDNQELGLIEVRFRRELPRDPRRLSAARPLPDVPSLPLPFVPGPPTSPAEPDEPRIPPFPGRPMAPPGWTPPEWSASSRFTRPTISAIASTSVPPRAPDAARDVADLIERAAGTGLTGHSSQTFVSTPVGPLEEEATVVRLRIVIGTAEAFTEPRPLPDTTDAPARPAARP